MRPVSLASLGTILLVAAVAPTAAGAGDRGSASTGRAERLAASLGADRGVLLGVSVDDPAGVETFAARAGKGAGFANVYVSFASASFPAQVAGALRERGSLPMVTWLPCRDGSLGPSQPQFSLRRIVDGSLDSYVRRWAAGAAAWGQPLFLRFAPEMNGTWNPWSAGVNGNSAHEFVVAWRHVHDLFEQAGASNVIWVWSPNVVMPNSPPLAALYPGDRYVDWIGIDGYNWGTTRARSRWQSFAQVFGPTLREVRQLTSKPLMLSEVGSAEAGGSKAAWITDFFRQLRRNRDILAFAWFNYDKEADWRVDSSPASRQAFAAAVADPRFRGAGGAFELLSA